MSVVYALRGMLGVSARGADLCLGPCLWFASCSGTETGRAVCEIPKQGFVILTA